MYDANPDIEKDFSSTTTVKNRLPISKYFFQSLENLELKLANIDIDNLHEKTLLSGLTLSEEKIRKKIKKIEKNLEVIKKSFENNLSKETISYNNYTYIENILRKFNDNLNEINPKTYLIKLENNDLYKCKIYLEDCESFDILDQDLALLLEGEFKKDNIYYQYVGNNIDLKDLNLKKNYNFHKFLNTNIVHDDGIQLEIDEENNLLKIEQRKIGARLSIINGSLKNTTIVYNGIDIINGQNKTLNSPPNYPIDNKGLTGCISYKFKLEDINLSASNSNCEDT